MNHSPYESAVSAVVWPWRDAADPRTPAGEAAHRRRQATIEAAIASSVGLGVLLVFDEPAISGIAFLVAAVVLTGGFFIPPLYRVMKRGGAALGRGVGVGLSWVLLVPFFYLCFTAGRIVLTLAGKDPLARKCPTAEPTYWVKHGPVTGREHYTRQYRVEA